MAFAPPRKPKTLEARQVVASRLPVSSPAKKSVTPYTSTDKDGDVHGARVIQSRYMQGATRRPSAVVAAAADKLKPGLTTTGDARQVKSHETIMASPSKIKLGGLSKEPLNLNHLRLRLSHTLQTCDAGEETLAVMRSGAESDLTARWLRVKDMKMRKLGHEAEERARRDALELASLSTEEIFLLETFIHRVDCTRADATILSRTIEAWSVELEAPPAASWDERTAVLLNQCDSERISVLPLHQRLEGMHADGIVKETLGDFLILLSVVREELGMQRTWYKQVWRQRCADVDAAYVQLLPKFNFAAAADADKLISYRS